MGKAREKRLKWLARKGLPSGYFYVIHDYGWGDGGCDGPFTADEALAQIHKENPHWRSIGESIKMGYTLKDILKINMDSTMTSYISDHDQSIRFQDFGSN